MLDLANVWRQPQSFEGTDHYGLRLANLTTTQRDALSGSNAARTGAIIFNTTTGQIEIYDGTNWVTHFAVDNISVAGEITVAGTTGTGTAPAGVLNLNTAEPTVVVGDQLGRIEFAAPQETGADATAMAAYIAAEAGDTFSATVNDTDLVLALGVSEAATIKYRWSPVAYHPEANDGAALGLAATAWADAYFASGAVIGFNNAYTITHSAALLTFSHAATFSGIVTPTAGIAAAGGFSAVPRNIHTGGNPATAAADGTNLDIVVTELYVAEVFVPSNMTITGVAYFAGANTNGNQKVMLFNSAGTRVAISASTDVSSDTADSYTRIPFSGTYAAVGPATYYVGIIADDNTHDINTHVVGSFGAGKITGLVYATEAGYASITVPTTFTTGLGPIASLY